jgi:DNA-binding NtrC family response regulator
MTDAKTILLVEDDSNLREDLARMLRRIGYTVIEAGDGEAALAALAAPGEVHLLFTDVVLPGPLSGLALAAKVAESRPQLPVLVTSGYDADTVFEGTPAGQRPAFLQKPYARSALRATLATLFGTGAGPAQAT